MSVRMSMIESDLKSRIEEEIREIVSRRTSEIIEDKLAQTAESPGLSAPPVRAIAPTLIDEGEIAAATAPTRVRPIGTVPYSSPPPPPSYYSAPPPVYSRPPQSFTGPPPPMSSNYPPSIPPASMVPSMLPSSRGDQWSGSYVVWPEVQNPSLQGALEAAKPRRMNAFLIGAALLSVALSGAAFLKSQAPAAHAPTVSVAAQAPAAPAPTTEDNSAQATTTAPAPTLNAPAAPGAGAPPWSRRYKGDSPMVATPTPKAANAKAVAPIAADTKTATKPADPTPVAAPAPSPAMDQANKTADLLRQQLDSSVH